MGFVWDKQQNLPPLPIAKGDYRVTFLHQGGLRRGFLPEISTIYVSIHGAWAIPDSWERKRLACPDAGAVPSPNLSPPPGGGQVGGPERLPVNTLRETLPLTLPSPHASICYISG